MENNLITILKDFLNGQKSDIDITEDLLKKAKQHEIEGIVYYQTKTPKLESKYYNLVYIYQQRLLAKEEIHQILPYSFTVKGLHIAQFYPKPYLRTCGDIDIVVPPSEKEKAADILEQNGYTLCTSSEKAEWHFEKMGFDYELHHSLLYDELVNDQQYKDYFSHCWEHVRDGELDWNFHFLFIFIHFRKHFMNKGVGLRYFIDLAVLTRNNAIDWEYIRKELEALGLLQFACTCYSLIEAWFDIPSPIGTVELSCEFIEQATAKILRNGVFGFNNKSNKNACIINQYLLSEKGKASIQISMTKEAIFPSYKSMSSTPRYSFVNNRPYLLPFAWVYRWCTRWKNSKQRFESIYIKNDKIQERKQYFEKWNLIDNK